MPEQRLKNIGRLQNQILKRFIKIVDYQVSAASFKSVGSWRKSINKSILQMIITL
jgi:hypothetical protein